jgi:hypothetical protein
LGSGVLKDFNSFPELQRKGHGDPTAWPRCVSMTVQRDFFRRRGRRGLHLVRKNGGIARQWLEKNGHRGNPGLTERPIRYIFRIEKGQNIS